MNTTVDLVIEVVANSYDEALALATSRCIAADIDPSSLDCTAYPDYPKQCGTYTFDVIGEW